jgi:hypothetical protein
MRWQLMLLLTELRFIAGITAIILVRAVVTAVAKVAVGTVAKAVAMEVVTILVIARPTNRPLISMDWSFL